MAPVTCTRCGREAEPLPFAPYPDELGARIQRSVCQACWREYMGRQTMVINEYRLDLMDPHSQEVLTSDLIEFLKLDEGAGGEGTPAAAEPESGGRVEEESGARVEEEESGGRVEEEKARG